jgi:hypothetical protein
VAGEDDRAATPAEIADELADLDHARGIEPVRRLVEEHEIGLAEQGARDPEPLLHAEGVRGELAVRALAEIDELEQAIDVGRRAAPSDALKVAEVRAAREVRVEGR